ncbi:MAG TPA: alpha/beta fold hydrolase [Candidatus Binatia bacterium]|jgi:dipeptidyl aminopeptidase/acylaminoacyl peptidase
MPREERITFHNGRKQKLVGVLHRPAVKPNAAAILCHGMESSKESEKIVALSRQLAERGILALRFDFAGSGESEGKFEKMTYSGEVENLRAAYNFALQYEPRKIGIFGSSMGGTVAVMFAAQEKTVAALATVAAPVHPEKFSAKLLTPEETRQWRTRGYIIYHDKRLNVSLLDDMERLDVPKAARKISCPALVIHGDKDDTVPVEEGRELFAALAGPKRLCVIEGSGHRLTEPAHLQKALAESIGWLTQHLG